MLRSFWKFRSVKKQRTPCIVERRAFSMPIGIPRRRTPVRIPSLPRLNVYPRFPLPATETGSDTWSRRPYEWVDVVARFFFFCSTGFCLAAVAAAAQVSAYLTPTLCIPIHTAAADTLHPLLPPCFVYYTLPTAFLFGAITPAKSAVRTGRGSARWRIFACPYRRPTIKCAV